MDGPDLTVKPMLMNVLSDLTIVLLMPLATTPTEVMNAHVALDMKEMEKSAAMDAQVNILWRHNVIWRNSKSVSDMNTLISSPLY